ncbi:hypothetical protein ACFLR7_03060 [Acidobacteriota bacterium]
MTFRKVSIILICVFILIFVTSSCAPGNTRFDAKPAGFWAGLWHGLILVITFIISLFTENVTMYEVNNSGGWYNFGFLLGAVIALGGGGSSSCKKRKKKSMREKEWEEIAVKVEEKVRKGINSWAEEEETKQDDWEEIGEKIEEKIKRELRKWAEK